MDYSFEKIANLAKLTFTDDEKIRIIKELDDMIVLAGSLSDYDASECKNTVSFESLRDDVPEAFASSSKEGADITVPRII